MDPQSAITALTILKKRDPDPTDVQLEDGRVLRVYNVAPGRDLGDEFDHVTTNISPSPACDHTVDVFYTNEIAGLVDPDTGHQLFP